MVQSCVVDHGMSGMLLTSFHFLPTMCKYSFALAGGNIGEFSFPLSDQDSEKSPQTTIFCPTFE